jgi:hypothetical protein
MANGHGPTCQIFRLTASAKLYPQPVHPPYLRHGQVIGRIKQDSSVRHWSYNNESTVRAESGETPDSTGWKPVSP